MRRFAPALGGRLSRRNIALSPHLWSATGVTFALFAISCLVIPALTDAFDAERVRIFGGMLAVVSLVMFATRPPEPGAIATHAVLASVYVGAAGSVVAFAPQGSATLVSGLFTGPLLAVWLRDRRAVRIHLVLASVTFAAAAVFTGDLGTLFATVCFVPSMWVLAMVCGSVLDAVEDQGAEYERLALRDPLTGVGNLAFLHDQLPDAVTRHRSSGSPLVVVDVLIDDFLAFNTTLGRAAGDGILATIAAVLSETAPPRTTVARTAGDRFTLVLADTDVHAAAQFVERARRRLTMVDTGGRPLATQVGVAAFPADGDDAQQLFSRATTRRQAADVDVRLPAPRQSAAGGLAVHAADELPVQQRSPAGTPSPEAQVERWSESLVTRRGLALLPNVWRVTGLFFVAYAAVGVVAMQVQPDAQRPATVGATILGVVIGAAILATRPPAIGTRRNHAVVAASYVMPVVAMAACAPHASWCVGMAAFAGALIGTRLTDRREVAGHLIAACVLCAALAVSGRADAASQVAMLNLLVCTAVLAGCYVSVLEPAEAQGRRMAELVLRDPLTGAGNQRLVHERIADELPRHIDMQMPLVMVDLELCGLDELRDDHGRGAVADLLRDVAVLLSSTAGSLATVARVHGGHFRLLLPVTGPDDLDAFVRDARRAIAATSRRGRPVLPRVGTAGFPDDGVTEDALVAIAQMRMTRDDPRTHQLEAADAADLPLPIRREVHWPRRVEPEHTERRRSAG
jgi:diguanylate cyclase (GGDEF)-like protein